MNALIKALIAALITGATGLIALWTGDGVTAFSDISGIQYGVLGMGIFLTFLKDLQSLFARPPKTLTEN